MGLIEKGDYFTGQAKSKEYQKELFARADAMYEELNAKYQTAPSSSSVKQKLKDKMDRIDGYRNRK